MWIFWTGRTPCPQSSHFTFCQLHKILYDFRYRRNLLVGTPHPIVVSEAAIMPQRGSAWEEEETLHLLDAIDNVLPINPAECEQVRALHNVKYECHKHTTKTLMRVYGKLARTSEPTGSPNMPPAVSVGNVGYVVSAKLSQKSVGLTCRRRVGNVSGPMSATCDLS